MRMRCINSQLTLTLTLTSSYTILSSASLLVAFVTSAVSTEAYCQLLSPMSNYDDSFNVFK